MNDDDRYTIEIIRDPDEFDAFRSAWDSLFERAHRPQVCQSFEWASCVWQTTMKPRGARLHVLVIREGTRPVLIWPLAILRHHRYWRAAVPLVSPSLAEYNEVLVEDSPESQNLAKLAVRSLRKTGGHDLIVTELVRANSLLAGALTAKPFWSSTTPYIEWTRFADWRAYERSLSARKEADRLLRRLQERGRVAFEMVEEPDRQRALIAWFMRQKVDRLAAHDKAPVWEERSMEDFIVNASRQVTHNGKFLFFTMTLDDELIAVFIVVECAYRLLAYQVAHAPGFEKYGLGFLIVRHVLHYAFDRQLPVELGCDNTQFKKSISNGADEVAMRAFSTNAWGDVRMAIRRFRVWQGQRREAQKIVGSKAGSHVPDGKKELPT